MTVADNSLLHLVLLIPLFAAVCTDEVDWTYFGISRPKLYYVLYKNARPLREL